MEVESKPKFVVAGYDDWSRRLLRSQKTGNVFVEVDGQLYTRTPDWEEPCDPIGKITDIERGRTTPSLKSCQKLADCYALDLSTLFNGVEVDTSKKKGASNELHV